MLRGLVIDSPRENVSRIAFLRSKTALAIRHEIHRIPCPLIASRAVRYGAFADELDVARLRSRASARLRGRLRDLDQIFRILPGRAK